ncbi:MAG: monovalent cation/H+ antiporter complex subunit F [Actinomycetota bacterium]|nr:monovalent cation/H+ antiporter complex subunit F [Actinomycetota bacterium]
MTIIIWVTIGILSISLALGIVRVITAGDDASRAAVSDLVFLTAIAIFVMGAMATGSAVLFDVAAVAALVGILGTIALARILTRGRR